MGKDHATGGARGHRRDRARRDGDDVRDRRGVRADRVHERHHRPFFFQFGITVAVAVLVSLFVSFTLDPMLSSVWHDPPGARFRRVPWLGRFMERDRARRRVDAPRLRRASSTGRSAHRKSGARDRARRRSSASFALVPLVGTEFVPRGRRELHLAAPQHAGRLEPRVHRRQGAAGRGGAARRSPRSTLAMTTVGTDEGRNYARVNLKLADRDAARALAEGARDARSARRCSRSPASSSRSASTGRSGSTSSGPDPETLTR